MDLLQTKKEIENIKLEKSQLKGELNLYKTQLKDLNLSSIKEAKKKIEDIKKDISEKRKILEEKEKILFKLLNEME